MGSRLTSEWTSGEALTSADLNDTFDAVETELGDRTEIVDYETVNLVTNATITGTGTSNKLIIFRITGDASYNYSVYNASYTTANLYYTQKDLKNNNVQTLASANNAIFTTSPATATWYMFGTISVTGNAFICDTLIFDYNTNTISHNNSVICRDAGGPVGAPTNIIINCSTASKLTGRFRLYEYAMTP